MIKDGKIIRDDANSGQFWDSPSFYFYCSNDNAHDIETISIIYERSYSEWEEEIIDEFNRQALYAS